MVRCSPEEILLEGKRKVAGRAQGDAGAGTDDVLSADVVDISQKRMRCRIELVEGADSAAGSAVAARVVELEVDAWG